MRLRREAGVQNDEPEPVPYLIRDGVGSGGEKTPLTRLGHFPEVIVFKKPSTIFFHNFFTQSFYCPGNP